MPQQRDFYWIVAELDGKQVLIYGGPDEKSATEKGYQELDCYFEVRKFNTRDIQKASQMLKGEKLTESQDLGASLERLKHTL